MIAMDYITVDTNLLLELHFNTVVGITIIWSSCILSTSSIQLFDLNKKQKNGNGESSTSIV